MNLFVSLLFVEMLTREVFHNKITFQAGATGPVLTGSLQIWWRRLCSFRNGNRGGQIYKFCEIFYQTDVVCSEHLPFKVDPKDTCQILRGITGSEVIE